MTNFINYGPIRNDNKNESIFKANAKNTLNYGNRFDYKNFNENKKRELKYNDCIPLKQNGNYPQKINSFTYRNQNNPNDENNNYTVYMLKKHHYSNANENPDNKRFNKLKESIDTYKELEDEKIFNNTFLNDSLYTKKMIDENIMNSTLNDNNSNIYNGNKLKDSIDTIKKLDSFFNDYKNSRNINESKKIDNNCFDNRRDNIYQNRQANHELYNSKSCDELKKNLAQKNYNVFIDNGANLLGNNGYYNKRYVNYNNSFSKYMDMYNNRGIQNNIQIQNKWYNNNLY